MKQKDFLFPFLSSNSIEITKKYKTHSQQHRKTRKQQTNNIGKENKT
jgi:hypothetical protein